MSELPPAAHRAPADRLDLFAAAPPRLEAFIIADGATTTRTVDFPSLS